MRTEVKVPNGILYFLVYLLVYPVLKLFFRLKVERGGPLPRGPFVVVCNHQSFMDFLLAMLTVYPHRLNAVAARKFFLYRPLNRLLPLMGCIPKSLFDPDPHAIMGMRSVLKRGGRVLLFPEGRCSVDGTYMGMHKSTGKLIKKFGVPVVSCRIEGSYTAMPLWRKRPRCGRVRVRLAHVFSAEELRRLPVEEINSRIDESLGGDRPPSAKPLAVFRAKRLAEGLENVLYYCPACGRQFTLETRDNTIFCTACGAAAVMDRAMGLASAQGQALPPSVHAWYKRQAVYENQLLQEGQPPPATQVTLRMPLDAGKGVGACGEGSLWLEPQGWHYDGGLLGQQVQLFFPIDTVPAMPFDPNDNVQIYAHGNFYLFTPENKRACVKCATIAECAYWRFAAPVQMTPGHDSGFCRP